MRQLLPLTLIITLSSNTYAEGADEMVSRSWAYDKNANYALDVNGRVKTLTSYSGCLKNCTNKDHPKKYFIDDKNRIKKDIDRFSTNTYQFKGDSSLVHKIINHTTGHPNEPKNITVFKRDKHGNIIMWDDTPRIYKKKGMMYELHLNPEEGFSGDSWVYFKDGREVRRITNDARAISPNLKRTTIPITETKKEYDYHKNGKLYKETTTSYQNGDFNSTSTKYFNDKGLPIKTFFSNIGDKNTGRGVEWINYKFDAQDNWIQREECQVEGEWGKHSSCYPLSRKIEYY